MSANYARADCCLDSPNAHNMVYEMHFTYLYNCTRFLTLFFFFFFQFAALGAISNVVVDFMGHKSVFMQCGGLKQLVHLSKSIDSDIRVNAVWALKNLAFLVNNKCKEEILLELSTSTLTSLVCGNYFQ